MRTVAIITARAGSRGVPGKNKKLFAGKPLVEWSIEAALKARMIDRVVVSTDDWDIAEIAKRCGVGVPFIRPPELARDDTPHIDVVLHALREVDETTFTHCCLLQPTSPLRIAADIDEACVAAAQNRGYSVLSVTEDRSYPFIVPRGVFGGIEAPPKGYLMRQRIDPRYYINGAIYVNPVTTLFKRRSFYAGKLMPYTMPKGRSLQIDDRFDFDVAEYVMYVRQEQERG